MSGCNCCEAPPAPSVTIECKSSAASKSKLGPCGYLNSGSYYSVRTSAWTLTKNMAGCYFPGPTPDTRTETYSSTRVSTKTVSGDSCVETNAWSGSIVITNSCGDNVYGCSSTQNTDGSWTGDCYVGNWTSEATLETTYSSVVTGETTADLIARAAADLPSYQETWTGSCSAYRNLSPDENSVSIRKFKWRLKHSPAGTCYLKIWMRQVTTPETGDPTYSAIDPYVWNGTGNPCLTDDTKSVTHDDNLIFGTEHEISVPTVDGTITVEVTKYSYVDGYEPDISDEENPQPSGYPDPTWTA